MWRYLTEAFWARSEIGGLGRIPWNVLAVTGVAVLGFGEHAIWLVGLGAETAYLYLMATNTRFQTLVDGSPMAPLDSTEETRRALISRLKPAMRERLARLEARNAEIINVMRTNDPDSFVIDGNLQALQQLSWLFLKLLVALSTLNSMEGKTSEAELLRSVGSLENEAKRATTSTLRESKAATLKITRQRLENLQRRNQTIQEMESDLNRIEAQVELALEDAAMKGTPTVISSNIGLVSNLLDDVYGEAAGAVAALDQNYTPSSASTSSTTREVEN